MIIQPFIPSISQDILDDLKARLARVRWTDEINNANWDYGTNREYLQSLTDYWLQEFDWKKQEKQINQFSHFRADIDGLGIHFIHERGKGPNPIPLLLLHGWPDSFLRYYKVIPMLTDPARFGGDPEQSFDVIVPSLPGFGFSDKPRERGFNTEKMATFFQKLMTEVLGYQQFAAVGGDFGSRIARIMGLLYPDTLIGLHLTDFGFPQGDPVFSPDLSNQTDAERDYLQKSQFWGFKEATYAMLQSSKPQTLAYGLNDSPVGLASWIVEKFASWSDGDIATVYSNDELLSTITLYWATQTIGSSFRIYFEDAQRWTPLIKSGQHIEVPAAIARFPKDLPGINPPRELAERSLRVHRWTLMPRGGHFAALEEPDLLVEDMRAFFKSIR